MEIENQERSISQSSSSSAIQKIMKEMMSFQINEQGRGGSGQSETAIPNSLIAATMDGGDSRRVVGMGAC